MTTHDKLTIGRNYRVKDLRLSGWTDGDGTGHEGYTLAAYFDADGRYIGPDNHGIEPIIEPREYRIAYAMTNGKWDVVETFIAFDNTDANAYAEATYSGDDWYVLDDAGDNING